MDLISVYYFGAGFATALACVLQGSICLENNDVYVIEDYWDDASTDFSED